MRKIAVVTGTRADFGLLKNLILFLQNSPKSELQLIITGTHLAKSYGHTRSEIESIGVQISAEVPIVLDADTQTGTVKSFGLAVLALEQVFSGLKPDLLVLLGDRYEALAAATTAMLLGVPIAHIHGGEATEGLIDEAIRHSVTKMSHLHFVTAESYRQRVLQLGENPKKVFNYGAPGLDNIKNLNALSKSRLEEIFNATFSEKLFLITFHPVTLEGSGTAEVEKLLSALDQFKDVTMIFTGSNADAGGLAIQSLIEKFCRDSDKLRFFSNSLGYRRYLSLMKICDVVVGNSSSGCIEAPSMGVPTVNIGTRQKGRLMAPSVIYSAPQKDSIISAILKCMSAEMKEVASKKENPYGKPGASVKIGRALEESDLSKILLKTFHQPW